MNSSSTSNSDPASPSRITTPRALAFLGGLVATIAFLNWLGGVKFDESDKWMGPIVAAPEHARPFDIYLFGTSRVAAAIDVEAFEQTLRSQPVSQIRSINLGMGYSRVSEYYFAAREVLAKRPDAFRGATVLLEAPLGLPEYATLDDNWMVEEASGNLAAYLHPSDLPAFLTRSPSTPLSKFEVVTQVLFGFREHFSRLRFHASQATKFVLSPSRAAPKEASTDLTSAGGIRVDSAGVAAVSEIARRHAQEEIRNQVPQRDWEKTTLRMFTALMQESGAKVVLFTIPLSPLQAAPLLTPIRQADRQALDSALVAWKIPMIHPTIQTDESDFPDYWHLRRSRAQEYSRALAMSYASFLGATDRAP